MSTRVREWTTACSASSVAWTSVRWVTTLTRRIDVERAARLREHGRVREVPLQEAQPLAAVALAGLAHGGRGDVDAHSLGGPEGGQQVPRPAPEVEHAQALGHADPQDAGQVVVVVAVPPPGALDPVVVRLVEAADLLEDRVRCGGGRLAHGGAESSTRVYW